MTPRRRRTRRDGMTLYEVMLALAIMLASMAVISGHVSTGRRAGVTSKLRTTAALLCETKLNDFLAGVEPMTSIGATSLPDDDGLWTWSAEVVPGPVDNVLVLDVTVEHPGDNSLNTVRYTLRRVIRDPVLYDESLESEAVVEEESE